MSQISEITLNRTIMDKESEKLLSFFKRLNVILLVINILIALPFSYMVSAAYQESKNKLEYISSDDSFYYDDEEDEDSYYYDEEETSDSVKKYNGWLLTALLSVTIFLSIFYYNLVLLLLKHFSNTAELKQIKKIEYLKETI
ncbi:hypothetical protein [Vagococcus fluvialis]|uniref:hypothetical protein n=1 Tax=Vagococcus fluvialis TaxID=2738 RepID=UPI003B5C0024